MNWGILLQDAPFGGVPYYYWLLDGLAVTLKLSLCSWIVAFAAGSMFGIMRTVPNALLRGLGAAYVIVFRNIPLIAQFFIWYLVVPELLPGNLGTELKAMDPEKQFFFLSAACLGLFTGGRLCEQVRSGLQALSSGQRSAGLALGLTLPQCYRYVLLPNAYRIIIPPMTSEMLNMIKNSAVASTIGLLELSAAANRLLEYSAHPYESFSAVTLTYAALNFAVMFLMRKLETMLRVPGTGPGGRNV
jgi:glutamate/aspartate transport system permease protein